MDPVVVPADVPFALIATIVYVCDVPPTSVNTEGEVADVRGGFCAESEDVTV